jgi:hypothetical protein
MMMYVNIVDNILASQPEGKRSIRRHRRRCNDDTKMDLKETVYEFVDLI